MDSDNNKNKNNLRRPASWWCGEACVSDPGGWHELCPQFRAEKLETYCLQQRGSPCALIFVWDTDERKKLLTVMCGGGHRPWDFYLNDDIHFVFIKKEVVYKLTLSTNRLKVISFSQGFHIREIECLKCLQGNTFMSGGEDTTLRLFSIGTLHQLKTAFVIRSHVSSIKAISYLLVDDAMLVVSVGGRAQMKIFRIRTTPTKVYEELASHMLKSANIWRKSSDPSPSALDLEPRHMDVHLHHQHDILLVYCAGSDAFWRIFTFDLKTKSLQLHKEIEYANFCVLKIVRLTWNNRDFIVTFSSDGKATFWDALTYAVVYQKILHQSSINSYDYVIHDQNQLILATGGDDATVNLSIYKNGLDQVNQMDCASGAVHEANVTGIKIVSNYVISASCDQKIVLWEWNTKNYDRLRQLHFIRVYHSFIPDIRGFETIRSDETRVLICVYGVGFETISVELKS